MASRRKMAGRRAGYAHVIDHAFAVVEVVVIGPVNHVVVVFEAVAIGGHAVKAAAWSALYARPQFQQVLEVPSLQGQLVDELVGHGAAERIRHGVDRRLLAFDLDGFRNRARIKLEIDADIGRHFQTDTAPLRGLEGGRGGPQHIDAGVEIGSCVFSRRVGLQHALDARLRIPNDHRGLGNDCAGLVGDPAHDASLLGLGGSQHAATEDCD